MAAHGFSEAQMKYIETTIGLKTDRITPKSRKAWRLRGHLAVVDAVEVIATEYGTYEHYQLRLGIATTAVQEEYLLGSLCVPKRRKRQDAEHRVERRVR